MAKKTEELVFWSHEENVTAEEFIIRASKILSGLVGPFQSTKDVPNLSELQHSFVILEVNDRLRRAAESIRKGEAA